VVQPPDPLPAATASGEEAEMHYRPCFQQPSRAVGCHLFLSFSFLKGVVVVCFIYKTHVQVALV